MIYIPNVWLNHVQNDFIYQTGGTKCKWKLYQYDFKASLATGEITTDTSKGIITVELCEKRVFLT
jgi:predicted small secreted protein